MKNLLFCLLTLFSYILIQVIPLGGSFVYVDLTSFEAEQLEEIGKNSVIVILAIVTIKKLQISRLLGIKGKSTWDDWYLLLFPTYLIFIGLLVAIDVDFKEIPITQIILLLISTLSIGFSEEFVFRGLIQSLLLKKLLKKHGKRALIISVLASSMIFGSFHLLDFKPENAITEVSQFLYATFIGVGFGAILLRTNKLSILAIIHGLIDFVFNIDELSVVSNSKPEVDPSIISAIVTIALVSPMFVFGLMIIRKLEVSSILEKQNHSLWF